MAWSRRLYLGAAALLGLGALAGQPEFIPPAMMLAAGGWYAHRTRERSDRYLDEPSELQRRLAAIEKRLSLTEGELASANSELEQLRAEREFDRQLLRKAADEAPPPPRRGAS